MHYANAGWTVGAVARRAELLVDLAHRHREIIALTGDITDQNAIEQIVHRFALETGRLDLVYANAGVGQRSTEEGWEPDRARLIGEINVVGSTNTITAAASVMIEQGFGRIVGVSSLAGCVPMPCAAAYGASKAWLAFYLRSLDLDLAPRGVRCSVVMPGYIATPMVDGSQSHVITPSAQKAAQHIAQRVAAGERIIRFPRRVAWLASLSAWVPANWRAAMQRRRLARRQTKRASRTAS